MAPPGRWACVSLGFLAVLAGPSLSSSARAGEVTVRAATVQTILREIKRPGAKAVLVNVWATWCEPCCAEMPLLLKFHREHGNAELRLVLVSADDESDRDKAIRFLASQGVDFVTWIKQGDDMTFIDALDPKWSGALPASFLFDRRARLQQSWYGEVTRDALAAAWGRLASRREGGRP